MKSHLSTVLLLASFFLIPPVVFAQSSAGGDAIETVGQGTINWTTGQIYATGIGAPPSNAVNPAQARAMAVRAAEVVALRNLLEIIKGVRVDSETVVENFMTKSDVIRTRVDGIVRGAMVVKTSYLSDGSAEVIVGMGMKGALIDAILPESFGRGPLQSIPVHPVPAFPQTLSPVSPPSHQLPPAQPQAYPEPRTGPSVPEPSKPAPPQKPSVPGIIAPSPASPAQPTGQFKGGKATGVVIDGRGLGLRPALLPKIVDPQGQEIYVGHIVTRTNAVEQGVAGYAKDVNAATNNFRVTDNPAVLRGLRASGAARTDVVLGPADAQMLRTLAGDGDFLQLCRVIIVY